MQNNQKFIQKLIVEHNNDEQQLGIITSNDNRIIVEAAAGSGKTKVLISSIAYRLITNKITSTKKILALTFSVNAAYKIKKDVIEKIPKLIGKNENYENDISKRISISNYHGLSRKILDYYGGKILFIDKNFNLIKTLSDEDLIKLNILDEHQKEIIDIFSKSIKNGDYKEYKKVFNKYNEVILKVINEYDTITYNSIISLAIYMLSNNDKLRKQYQKLFEYIIVDECQDTNILGYDLLNNLINEDTKLLFFGDPLQRIYGFIGALPNVMQLFETKHNMTKITLNYNYRFKNNKELLSLDRIIRLNSQNIIPNEVANPFIICSKNYQLEYKWLINKIKDFDNETITILVKSFNFNKNTEYLLELLDENNINYFNALFSDESDEYIMFHKKVYSIFYEEAISKMKITKKVLEKCYRDVCDYYNDYTNKIYSSLIILLRCFLDSIYEISSVYKLNDIIYFMVDVLLNNGLKQYMNRINEKLVVATVHSFKGLESDIVFVVDLENKIFPSYQTCKKCTANKGCMLNNVVEKIFLEELSVFYVANTRAKKQLFLSYSENQKTPFGISSCNRSCLLNLPGIGFENLIYIE